MKVWPLRCGGVVSFLGRGARDVDRVLIVRAVVAANGISHGLIVGNVDAQFSSGVDEVLCNDQSDKRSEQIGERNPLVVGQKNGE